VLFRSHFMQSKRNHVSRLFNEVSYGVFPLVVFRIQALEYLLGLSELAVESLLLVLRAPSCQLHYLLDLDVL
jgi:hypothetical protein